MLDDEPEFEPPWLPPARDLDDATTHPRVLTLLGLWTWWPEPRLLEQTRVWIDRDRETWWVESLDADEMR